VDLTTKNAHAFRTRVAPPPHLHKAVDSAPGWPFWWLMGKGGWTCTMPTGSYRL
jgi:hypothetical protein